MRQSTKTIAYFILYVSCYFVAPIFAQTDAIVDLGYARYQGVSYLDPVNKANNTQFLGIRYAAAPTGKVYFLLFLSLIFNRNPSFAAKQALGGLKSLSLLCISQVFS